MPLMTWNCDRWMAGGGMATDSLHAAVHSGTSLSHPPCLHSPHTHANVLVCCKRHVLGLEALMVALSYCCSFAANMAFLWHQLRPRHPVTPGVTHHPITGYPGHHHPSPREVTRPSPRAPSPRHPNHPQHRVTPYADLCITSAG
jgi:hypothetical protein